MRYTRQTEIAPGDILYVVGASVESGTYQGRRLRSGFITLDTSCRRRFGKVVKDANLDHSFKGMFAWKDSKNNNVYILFYNMLGMIGVFLEVQMPGILHAKI